jgi:hypothetical protein
MSPPHRLQPKEVYEFLERTYTALYLKEDKSLLDQVISRDVPGNRVLSSLEQKARDQIYERVDKAAVVLFNPYRETTCNRCHEFEVKEKNQLVPDRIVPTAVPQVWFKHAVFDHNAHRAMKCQECHTGVENSKDSNDVLLPKMETCIKCHAPATSHGGGARYDCAECHRYHNGDQPLQGKGAHSRGVRTPMDTNKFLKP